MKIRTRFVLVVAAFTTLAGCGSKGAEKDKQAKDEADAALKRLSL